MTALADDRITDFAGRTPNRGSYGVKANVRIFRDSIVCLDVAGRAMPGGLISTGALFAVGKSSAQYDNRTASQAFVPLSGLADACNVEVEFGIFAWTNSGGGDIIATADVGKACYVADDQTVALTSAGGTRPIAGVITEVRGGQVFVLSSPETAAFLLSAAPLLEGGVSRVQVAGGTFVAGTATIGAGIVVTASTDAFIVASALITGSTNVGGFAHIKASNVAGAAGVGSVTLNVITSAGILDADAAGAFRVLLVN